MGNAGSVFPFKLLIELRVTGEKDLNEIRVCNVQLPRVDMQGQSIEVWEVVWIGHGRVEFGAQFGQNLGVCWQMVRVGG